MRCGNSGNDRLLAFDCRRREFCHSWGSQRLSQTTAYLADQANLRVQVSKRMPPLPAAGPGDQEAGRGVAAEDQPGATKELVADYPYRSTSGTRHPGLKTNRYLQAAALCLRLRLTTRAASPRPTSATEPGSGTPETANSRLSIAPRSPEV